MGLVKTFFYLDMLDKMSKIEQQIETNKTIIQTEQKQNECKPVKDSSSCNYLSFILFLTALYFLYLKLKNILK